MNKIAILFVFSALFVILAVFSNFAFASQESPTPNINKDFPKSIKIGEKAKFSLRMSNPQDYPISNIEPVIEIIPKNATDFVHVEISPRTSVLMGGFYQVAHGTLYVDKDIPADRIFVSVSFMGKNPEEEQVALASYSTFNASIQIDKSQNGVVNNSASVLENIQNSTQIDTDWYNPRTLKFNPPLVMLRNGIDPTAVVCNEPMNKLYKPNGNIPVCVMPETVEKLTLRGWTTIIAHKSKSNSGYTEIATVRKLLSQNQIKYVPDKLVIASGPILYGDPRCGVVVDVNSTTHWFGIDSISNPQKMTLFSENPNPCKVNTGSCFCDAQMELTARTLDHLSYFTPEEEEKTANALMDYLVKENINRTPKFLIGKFNLNYTDPMAIGYCGELWGYNKLDYFDGAIVNNKVMDYGLTDERPPLCAIHKDAAWWERK